MNIYVIATLDTKGEEAGFIRDGIRARGHTPVVVDPGSSGTPMIAADIPRQQVAEAAGLTLEQILARGEKAFAQQKMTEGLVTTLAKKYAEGALQAVISVGGGQGTAIATAAMQVLPVGVPKVMVSTVANGRTTFGPYVGTKDITMIHSVADIAGLNFVTRTIIAQATAAVVAMAEVPPETQGDRELVALTQAGVTTPGVMAIKSLLEKAGMDVIIFHCNGIGGEAMEELIREKRIQGVIDYSPHEITDLLYDGLMPALPGRLTAAGQMGIPQIIAPGCADMRVHAVDQVPDDLEGRPFVRHTPTHMHYRTTKREMGEVADYVADHLNLGHGPRAVVVPQGGYSMMNREGMPLYDREANRGFLETLQTRLQPEIRLVEVPYHINDLGCAQQTFDLFMQLRKETKP